MLDIDLPEDEDNGVVLNKERQLIPSEYIGAVPLPEYDACRQSIAEMKQRFLRNGICPNDNQKCKHANNCSLLKADTCFNFKALRNNQANVDIKRTRSSSNILCIFCARLPADTKEVDCPHFRCMVAYKGR
jgi:hypothetical protein